MVARLAAYRHVWFAMANEFDLVPCKNIDIPTSFTIWDDLFKALVKYDPYSELRMKEISIHECRHQYNYSQPWLTHFGVQGYEDTPRDVLMTQYKRDIPVILDEVHYEGNSTDLGEKYTGGVIADRFWMGNANGNYVGHSEALLPTFVDDTSDTYTMWWNYGGILRGFAPNMIGFFKEYMTDLDKYPHPAFGKLTSECLMNNTMNGEPNSCLISQLSLKGEYYLIHWTNYATNRYIPSIGIDTLQNGIKYKCSWIDWFNMDLKVIYGDINGDNQFVYTPPTVPFNIELIKIA